MCENCYAEYGYPTIMNDRVATAMGLISEVYGIDGVGGRLHAQLDDWNIEDEFWEMGEENLSSLNQQERRCLDAMKALTLEERASALARYAGYFSSPPKE